MKKYYLLSFLLLFIAAAGCATSVQRVETEKVIDLSGRWNDTDSRLVSDEMIKDALNRSWLNKFKSKNQGDLPVVIVGTVRNRTHEHINVHTFVKDLERALVISDMVEFVASKGEREELREERKDQARHASEETAKAMGEEIAADFMLKGVISSIVDKIEGKEVKFYQVNLELLNLESNKKVWIGEKKIKKYIKRSRYDL